MNDKIVPIESEELIMSTSTPIQSKFPEKDGSNLIEIDSSQLNYSQQQGPILRSNQRMVRSLLYMGQLLNLKKVKSDSQNDFLVNSLETITSLMDNVYLITKFGIGQNSKFLSKIGSNASKVWFVTLLITIRKIIKDLIRLYNLKTQVWKEIKFCEMEQLHNPLAKLILEKYELKLQDIQNDILGGALELVGSLNDLFFVSIEIFKLKVPRWIEKLIGFISAAMMIYRMSKRS